MGTPVGGEQPPVKIAPGDLAFLLKECPREFYDKYRHGIRRPGIFPKVFNVIDRAMKQRYANGEWHEIEKCYRLRQDGLEALDSRIRFRVIAQDGWVTSEALPLRGGTSICIRGAFDTVVEFEDGERGVCDFKTTFPKHEHLWFYRRPLHAYAYACEHPSGNMRHRYVVPRLGLLVFNGTEFASSAVMGGIVGDLSWVELDRTDDLFLRFMQQAANLLALPAPPPPGPDCDFCKYRGLVRAA